MGWFGFSGSSSPEQKRAEEIRSGAVAPSRSERQRCWESRDGYFACLDRNGIIDAVKDEKAAARACPGEGIRFEQNCATEWVTYFKKWRLANYQKDQRLKKLEAEQATKVDIQSMPGDTVPAKR